LARALDVVGGLVLGGVIWIILNVLLSFIPLIGWMFAAFIGGYVAGRLGGTVAAAVLAVLSPIVIGTLGAALIGIVSTAIPIPFLWEFLGGILGTIILVWALINLTFVGLGGYFGNKSYRFANCPNCGERIAKGALVCPICGRDLRLQSPQRTETTAPAKERTEQPREAVSTQIKSSDRQHELAQIIAELKKQFTDDVITEENYRHLKATAEEELRKEYERRISPEVKEAVPSHSSQSPTAVSAVRKPEPVPQEEPHISVIGTHQISLKSAARVIGVRETRRNEPK
jgi:uncharacterized Zn finger protein (UPF0148 family)